MLYLLLALALAQPAGTARNARGSSRLPRDGRCSSRDVTCGRPPAFFEFAPASGAGMGTACAGTVPTGAKGETMSFSRGSVATCLKGNTTTNIANGDLVKLSANQPRVMPGGDGTGGLGILIEEQRTNSLLWSEALNNAVWADNQTGSSLPVITADYGTAPDSTLTAERIQVPATSGSTYSQHYQLGACPASTVYFSCFIRGVSGSGTFDMTVSDGTVRSSAACPYTSTYWNRCILPAAALTAAGNVAMGSLATYGAPCLGAAADVLVWGCQCEATIGLYDGPSSYIPTTNAPVTRNFDALSVNRSVFAAAIDTSGSVAATVLYPWNKSFGDILVMNGGGRRMLTGNTSGQLFAYDGTNFTYSSVVPVTPNAPTRVFSFWSVALVSLCRHLQPSQRPAARSLRTWMTITVHSTLEATSRRQGGLEAY